MKRMTAVQKELAAVSRREKKLESAAMKAKPATWKIALEKKVPQKVYAGLESAFCKAFSAVFNQGRSLLEKSYNKEELLAVHGVRDAAVKAGGRRELRRMDRGAKQAGWANMAITTAEGLGLGALGIGMPDIVLFISTLFKGVYETALNYGYDYESKFEQLLILKMMAASLSSGEARAEQNAEIDYLLPAGNCDVSDEEFDAQMQKTAGAFAMDMLLLKFIQGILVVGILGGAANPYYYRKVMKYVQLKYRKRYLMSCRQQ